MPHVDLYTPAAARVAQPDPHTFGPAPWRAVEGDRFDNPGRWSVHDDDGAPVCRGGGNVTNENAEGNARLIAAAPDLLAALFAVVRGGCEGRDLNAASALLDRLGADWIFDDGTDGDGVRVARAAIAKAEGRS